MSSERVDISDEPRVGAASALTPLLAGLSPANEIHAESFTE